MAVIQFNLNKSETCIHCSETSGTYANAIAALKILRANNQDKLVAVVFVFIDSEAHAAWLENPQSIKPLCRKTVIIDETDPTFSAAYSAATTPAESRTAALNYLAALPEFDGGTVV